MKIKGSTYFHNLLSLQAIELSTQGMEVTIFND